jgi:hypothetical protein
MRYDDFARDSAKLLKVSKKRVPDVVKVGDEGGYYVGMKKSMKISEIARLMKVGESFIVAEEVGVFARAKG